MYVSSVGNNKKKTLQNYKTVIEYLYKQSTWRYKSEKHKIQYTTQNRSIQ